jgi:hypothetical protein
LTIVPKFEGLNPVTPGADRIIAEKQSGCTSFVYSTLLLLYKNRLECLQQPFTSTLV